MSKRSGDSTCVLVRGTSGRASCELLTEADGSHSWMPRTAVVRCRNGQGTEPVSTGPGSARARARVFALAYTYRAEFQGAAYTLFPSLHDHSFKD